MSIPTLKHNKLSKGKLDMVQHFLPFQNVTVAVFQVSLYFLYLLSILTAKYGRKIMKRT